MEEKFIIKRKDFKNLERYAEEYEELYNLAPVVKVY